MTTNPPPDQTDNASAVITEALFASSGAITHSTARLIAAALHTGPETPLQAFAASGRFDPDVLRREVTALAVTARQRPWRDALLAYVDAVQVRTHPWSRGFAPDKSQHKSEGLTPGRTPFAHGARESSRNVEETRKYRADQVK